MSLGWFVSFDYVANLRKFKKKSFLRDAVRERDLRSED
jgi:hypothetical protein